MDVDMKEYYEQRLQERLYDLRNDDMTKEAKRDLAELMANEDLLDVLLPIT